MKGGKAALQPVKVDLTQGNIALIASGISVGDQVVVDGQERLQAGTPVEVHNVSSANPAGGSGGSAAGPAKIPISPVKSAAKIPEKSPEEKKDKKQGNPS